MTHDPREQRLILGMPPVGFALVVMIAVAALTSGIAIALLMDGRDQARTERDVVLGQAQELVDCVKDPLTTDCQAEAEQAEETIDEVAQGEPGPAGATGPQGVQGLQGIPGPQGIRGPRGFIGPVGPSGPRGAVGATGDDGAQGPAGAAGAVGPQGPQGEPGPPGRDGTAQVGTYSCPDAQYVAGFSVGDAGFVTLDCRHLPTPPEQPPAAIPKELR